MVVVDKMLHFQARSPARNDAGDYVAKSCLWARLSGQESKTLALFNLVLRS
jgi:hypothetical protein